MSPAPRSAVVVGGGVFGLTAALELNARRYRVEVVDPGPVPHPAASSTDVSKAVRMDYGRDGFYSDLAARALDGWRNWSRLWERPLFHEVGILLISRGLMGPGSFEGDAHEQMLARRVPVERLNATAIARRFPAWRAAGYADGYFNPWAGWVESGAVVSRLATTARSAGVRIREGARCAALSERGARVIGVALEDGTKIEADWVVVAAGAWTPRLLPYLAPVTWAVGQPVVLYRPLDPLPFEAKHFPVWCADISTTGWYGFPVNADGHVKIGNHGAGRDIAPGEPLELIDRERRDAADFVARNLPDLEGAPVAGGRICLYCDTFDGNFLIDRDPDRPGLVVAAGGSGHGFKFAPLLGEIIADALEGRKNAWGRRFAWRASGERSAEHARHAD